jgi:O-antigen/teichoic acid export membrane protein
MSPVGDRPNGQDVRVEIDRHDRAESSGVTIANNSHQEAPEGTPRRRRLHPFFRDISLTMVAQACVALGGLLLARLLARNTGADGFASYSLVKQAVNVLFPVVTVGLVGGLPRYIALPREKGDPGPGAYLAAGALICWGATAAAAAISLAVPSKVAALFFGSSDASEYVLPFVLLLAATSTFYIAYGYFRGLLRLKAGSLLQVVALAALPPAVVVALPEEPVDRLIVVMAVGTAVLSLFAVALPLARGIRATSEESFGVARRRLWDYGYRRIPGEMAQLGLFVLVPILAAHVASLTDVAYLSAGQQVLSIASLAVLPLGLVLLPSLARMWAEDRERTSRYVAQLSAFAASLAIFVSLQAVLFAQIAVVAWLGDEFEDAGAVVTVTVAPTALFVVYLMLRSTLDAVAVKSYNSRNNLVALVVFAAVAAALLGFDLCRPVMGVAWAFAAGVAVQGLLTFATVHRFFGVRWSDYGLPYTVPLGLAAGGIGLLARPAIEGSPSPLLFLIALQALLGAAYFGALAISPVRWPRLLAERFFDR